MACPGCSCGMAQIEAARRVDKIEIKPIDPKKLLDANNMLIILNGQPIKNPHSIELKVVDGGTALVKLELFAKLSMDESIVKDAEVVDGTKA